MSKPARGGRKG